MKASNKPNSKKTMKASFSTKWAGLACLGILLIIGLAAGWYFYANRGSSAQQESRKYQAEIGRLAILPDNEQPALATITDPSKLGHQKFFKDSKKGDKVLIYSEGNVVVLYRPSAHKIVNMGPVEIAPLDETAAKKRR